MSDRIDPNFKVIPLFDALSDDEDESINIPHFLISQFLRFFSILLGIVSLFQDLGCFLFLISIFLIILK